MPDFTAIFKDEVRRLARKEIKQAATDLKGDIVSLKRHVAEQRKKIDALVRENRRLARALESPRDQKFLGVATQEKASKADSARISAKMIRSLRSRLGLTQAEFAKLLGVSGQSIYQWEAKEGRLNLRDATKSAVVDIRAIGSREARRRLQDMR